MEPTRIADAGVVGRATTDVRTPVPADVAEHAALALHHEDPAVQWAALDALLGAMGFGLLKRRALRPKADFGATIEERRRNLSRALTTALSRVTVAP
jgi:hypothetical protein